ncbi:hypothetical protein BDN70DRAFT_900506 [Pholiota conissans]|uniref:Uncharacterized protein n=1 Tax=Pholiota conissans TaxID=109636 RepID=A0A9P5YPV1_9AGAR|nr:hypothetical protein BDN70DRAFT_900506 [Pholiota conissans]
MKALREREKEACAVHACDENVCTEAQDLWLEVDDVTRRSPQSTHHRRVASSHERRDLSRTADVEVLDRAITLNGKRERMGTDGSVSRRSGVAFPRHHKDPNSSDVRPVHVVTLSFTPMLLPQASTAYKKPRRHQLSILLNPDAKYRVEEWGGDGGYHLFGPALTTGTGTGPMRLKDRKRPQKTAWDRFRAVEGSFLRSLNRFQPVMAKAGARLV